MVDTKKKEPGHADPRKRVDTPEPPQIKRPNEHREREEKKGKSADKQRK